MKAIILDVPTSQVFITKEFLNISNQLKKYRLYDQKIKLEDKFKIKFPPANSYNRGLLFIAAVLEGIGISVKYYNADYDKNYWNKCKKQLLKADLLLASAKTNNYHLILDDFKKAKIINKKIKTIIGGPHPTALPEECLEDKNVDFVVLGEGEETINELCSLLKNKKNNFQNVLGIGFKKNSKIYINKLRPLIVNLDQLPMPAYHLLPGGLRSYHPYIDTSRGCVYGCNFCSGPNYWRKTIRTRSFKNFYQELRLIKSLIGEYNFLHISDPMLGVTSKQIEILNNLKNKKHGLYFSCDVKANYINKKLIKLMINCGIILFSIGIESLNDIALILTNKKCTAKLEMEACKIIKKFNKAFIKSYWIVGLPGENKKSLIRNNNQIYKMLKTGIVDQVCNHILVPYPGTEFFSNYKKFGIKILHKNWKHYEGRSYPVVYNLKKLPGNEIYKYFLQANQSELQYYVKKYPHLINKLENYNLPKDNNISFGNYKGRLI
ncbi:MAG TPA: radical SAM protein [bacterium]|nr:radical SAM protein [bacterium]HPL95394.1 radical SAM protein [bacterium]